MWKLMVVCIVLLFSCFLFSAEKAKIELFVMSQCPYGIRALESARPVIEKGDVDFHLYFIAEPDTSLPYGFSSLHGTFEVEEDIRWLVILKYYPERFWSYFNSRATHYNDQNWRYDAIIAGIDPDTLHMLVVRDGSALLAENIKRTQQLLVDSSPTIYVNGVRYVWDRTSPSLAAVVNRFSKRKFTGIPECFTDNDCFSSDKGMFGKCNSEGKCVFTKAERTNLFVIRGDTAFVDSVSFLKTLKNFEDNIPGLKTEIFYYKGENGKKLMKKLDIKELPAFVFDETIEKSELFQRMKDSGFLKEKKEKYYRVNPLYLQTEFYPEREVIPRRLDVFISLDCPAGNATLKGFAELLNTKALQKRAQIMKGKKYSLIGTTGPISVASGETSGTTMKGSKYTLISGSGSTAQPLSEEPLSFPPVVWIHFIPKVDTVANRLADRPEIIAEMKLILAVEKYYPGLLWDFISCRVENPFGDWKSCARASGLPSDSLEKIVEKEGDNLLLQDLKIKDALRIEVSPTFIYENRYRFLSVSTLKKIEGLERVSIDFKSGCR